MSSVTDGVSLRPHGCGHAPFEVQNLIAGRWEDTEVARLERRNPADQGRVVATVPRSNDWDATAAVDAAVGVSSAWRQTPPAQRSAMIARALDELEARAAEIAVADVLESGKTLAECRGEVERSLGTVRAQLELVGNLEPQRSTTAAGAEVVQSREPVGVALVITPWNFPFSALLRKVVPAMLAGNAVVAKPSELTPMTAVHIGQAFSDAGLPAGVLNIVHGPGQEVGEALVRDERVGAISFTGSARVGMLLGEVVGRRDTKIQLEMGGKNAMVVLADADLELAVADAVVSGFTAAGQWCVATSRIFVERGVYSTFARSLSERARGIRVGAGLDDGVEMGPVSSAEHYRKVMGYLSSPQETPDPPIPDALFIAPVVVESPPLDSDLLRDEVFGPVVAVIPCDGVGHAIRMTNDSSYGLAASIYTTDTEKADRFVAEVKAAKVNVNLPTAFGDNAVASGGWKDSGRGEREGALEGLLFYTRPKVSFARQASSRSLTTTTTQR